MCACKNRHRFSREQAFERVRHRMASGPAGCAASVPPVSGPRRARPWSGGAAPRRAPGTPRRACETPGFPPATRPARTTCAAVAFSSLRGGLGASEEAEFLSADEKRLDVISTDRCRLHQNHNVPKKRNSVLEVTGLGLRHQRKRPSSVVDHPQLDEISLFLHFTF